MQRFWSLLTHLHPSYFLLKLLGFLRAMSTTSCMGNGQPHGRHLPPWSELCFVFFCHLGSFLVYILFQSDPVDGLMIFSKCSNFHFKFFRMFFRDIQFNKKTTNNKTESGKLVDFRDFQRVPLVSAGQQLNLPRRHVDPKNLSTVQPSKYTRKVKYSHVDNENV